MTKTGLEPTKCKKKKSWQGEGGQGGCEPRIEVIVKMKKKKSEGGPVRGGGGGGQGGCDEELKLL